MKGRAGGIAAAAEVQANAWKCTRFEIKGVEQDARNIKL